MAALLLLEESETSSDDIIITRTTKKPRKRRKDVKNTSECVIIGSTTNKRKKRATGNNDCKISHVSHDQDVLYVRTKKPPLMRKEITSTSSCTAMTFSTATSGCTSCCCPTRDQPIVRTEPTSITSDGYRPLNPDLRLSSVTRTNDRDASLFSVSSSAPYASTLDTPPWWSIPTSKDQLAPDTPTNFTMVPLDVKSSEGCLVVYPLKVDGFKVSSIKRIQCPSLWRRYIGEVRLFLEERGANANLNEKLLYHCSRTDKSVICSEGLDMRLSNQGLFGRGIYFSNKPRKCDHYGSHSVESRHMFACKVILGDVKSYPNGDSDRLLTREPKKPDGSYYDSVMGFISVGEEYVIYNNYRAIPLYYIEYR